MKTLIPKQTKIELLFPYENNAKLHPQDQIDKIIRSIELTGFDQPLVANNENGKLILIKGHGRLEAAKQMGLTEVPCVVLNIPIETANKARLMDNKAAESPYDVEKLLEELRTFSSVEILDTGYDEEEIKDLLAQLDQQIQTYNPMGTSRQSRAKSGNKDGNFEDEDGYEEEYENDDDDDDDNDDDGIDRNEMWTGMPEFQNENAHGVKQIVVHFKTMEDFYAFRKLVGQDLNETTRFMYFPEPEERVTGKGYIS